MDNATVLMAIADAMNVTLPEHETFKEFITGNVLNITATPQTIKLIDSFLFERGIVGLKEETFLKISL